MLETSTSMGGGSKITADEVISKLKDDGDFDRLRLKIIRKLKDNEDLRNSIISAVKQSETLNHANTENIKQRELCDAIHDEVREKVMSQISDALWEIIRSPDGIKTEITGTVQFVYDKLVNPQGSGGSASSLGRSPSMKDAKSNGSITVSGETDGALSDGENQAPPGFSLQNHVGSSHENGSRSKQPPPDPSEGRPIEEEREANKCHAPSGMEDGHLSPPGFSSLVKRGQPADGSDEDLDAPPGFG